jgi:hypothetical protein
MAAFQRFHQSNFIHVDKYCALVTTPWSHFNECSHFKPSSAGHSSLLRKNPTLQPFCNQFAHVRSHYVIALEMVASKAGEDFRPNKKKPWADCSIRW